jgi:hypothetical protein
LVRYCGHDLQLIITLNVAVAEIFAVSFPVAVTVNVYVPAVIPPVGGGLVTVTMASPVAAW